MHYFIWLSEQNAVDRTGISACPTKMPPRGKAETQIQVSTEVILQSNAVLLCNTKESGSILA